MREVCSGPYALLMLLFSILLVSFPVHMCFTAFVFLMFVGLLNRRLLSWILELSLLAVAPVLHNLYTLHAPCLLIQCALVSSRHRLHSSSCSLRHSRTSFSARGLSNSSRSSCFFFLDTDNILPQLCTPNIFRPCDRDWLDVWLDDEGWALPRYYGLLSFLNSW